MSMRRFRRHRLAMAGLARIRKTNKQLFYLITLITLYFILISAGAEAQSRLRVPIMPVLVLPTATGLIVILDYLNARRVRS